MNTYITLSGFGTFEDNEEQLKELKEISKKNNVECYATYYDHELKGEVNAIESILKEMYGMTRDQWNENALQETVLG